MKTNKYLFLVLMTISLVTIIGVNFYKNNNVNPSRIWMQYAMDIVREEKPTPPESARFYAAVATSYNTCLSESEEKANACTSDIVNFVFPNKVSSTTEFLEINKLKTMSGGDAEIVKEIKRRYEEDGRKIFSQKFFGPEYWSGDNPLSPTASQWERWNLKDFTTGVLPPPEYMSKEYQVNLQQIKESAAKRNSEQVAIINFWGGIPGTEAPAGIWQNRFYAETKNLNLSDEKYAYIQMILAQALADSFVECWKVKYTYYTKRPSMVDENINLAMRNPNFPSYTSGHSTISATAATVLGHFFQDKKEIFMSDAVNAKNSRLWAGIHFPYDNEEGFKLGEKIGKYYLENIVK